MSLCMDWYSCACHAMTGDIVLSCKRLDRIVDSVACELKLYFLLAYSTATRKDRPPEAAWPPTHHVRRHRPHDMYVTRTPQEHRTDTYNGRTYNTRMATYTRGARGVHTPNALRRFARGRRARRRRSHSAVTRRHALAMRPRPSTTPRRKGAAGPRRAPRRRCRPARRPPRRAPCVPS